MATAALETALIYRDDHFDARAQLAWIYLQREEWERAIEMALSALDRTEDPEARASLHQILSAGYGGIGQSEGELHHLREAARSAPGDAALQHRVGLLLLEQGDWFSAMPHLEAAASLAPEEALYRLSLGRARIEVARYSEGVVLLRSLLVTELHEPAHLLLVRCDLLQARPDAALKRARGELEVNPGSGLAWAALALALLGVGDRREARGALERARSLAPEDPWVKIVESEFSVTCEE
jgi:tetratricopeptide (TPR) repeat protein